MQTQPVTRATPLSHCTLTGVDDATNIDHLFALGERFPFVEWGPLYSESQAGTGRYPSQATLSAIARRLAGTPARPSFALHVCGRAVSDFLRGVGRVSDIAEAFDLRRAAAVLEHVHRWQSTLGAT